MITACRNILHIQAQMRIDGGKDALSQLMGFEQAAELEQRRCVGCRFPIQIDTTKPRIAWLS